MARKGIWNQTQPPESDPWDPHSGQELKEATSCSLTPTCMLLCTHISKLTNKCIKMCRAHSQNLEAY